ncbi:MAG: histidine kinase [Cyclobacteriaceae bacterium]
MKFILQACFSFFLFSALAQSSNDINYTINEGLPSNTVYCSVQDDRGFMWFGTDAGLSRFDGYEFKNFYLEDGLPDTDILNFYRDTKGRIWMYTTNGEIGYIYKGHIYTSQNDKMLSGVHFNSRITSIVEKDETIILSSLNDGILILWEDGASRVESNRPTYLCNCGDDLFFLKGAGNSKKGVWVKSQLFSLDMRGKSTPSIKVIHDFEISEFNEWMTYLVCANDWLVTAPISPYQYLSIFDTRELKYQQIATPFDIYNLKFRDGQILLMTENGIYSFDVSLGLSKVGAYSSVSSSLIDYSGNEWVTTLSNGVYLLPKKRVSNIESDLRNVNSLHSGFQGLYFSSSNRNIYLIDTLNTISRVFSSKIKKRFYFILEDDSSRIWIGSNGLFLDGLAFENRLLSTVTNFGMMDDSLLVSATRERIQFTDLSSPSYTTVYLNHDVGPIHDGYMFSFDSILFVSEKGVFWKIKDSISRLNHDIFVNLQVNEVEYFDDKLWFATEGKGLIGYDGDRSVQLSEQDGLASAICTHLMIHDSVIYVSTPLGINRVKIRDTGYEISLITSTDGLSSYQINGLEQFNDTIFVAQNDGLSFFPASETFQEPNDFPVIIEEVKIGNRSIQNNEMDFSHNPSVINITFKAIQFQNHDNLSYQYRLIDNDNLEFLWTDSKSNSVAYSHVQPGNYVFQVRSKTKNSDWTVPAEYSFNVHPALWQMWWFQTSIYLLGIVLSVLIYRSYEKSRESKRELSADKLLAEIKALKAQINPHFLFNALNSIQAFIIANEHNQAEDYLVKYSQLMRKVLVHSDTLTVLLSDELEILKLYVTLEQLRVKQEFDFEVEIEKSVDPYTTSVPSMVVQPFIENAIWHGISDLNHRGKITLDLRSRGMWLEVHISDNGVGFDQSKSYSSGSRGVNLVKERLRLLNKSKDDNTTLRISSELGKGTVVTLRFQKQMI